MKGAITSFLIMSIILMMSNTFFGTSHDILIVAYTILVLQVVRYFYLRQVKNKADKVKAKLAGSHDSHDAEVFWQQPDNLENITVCVRKNGKDYWFWPKI